MKKRFIFITLFASCILFAATAMAQQDTAPRENTEFFNGQDLTGWSGNDGYWSVKDGVSVGWVHYRASDELPKRLIWRVTGEPYVYITSMGSR